MDVLYEFVEDVDRLGYYAEPIDDAIEQLEEYIVQNDVQRPMRVYLYFTQYAIGMDDDDVVCYAAIYLNGKKIIELSRHALSYRDDVTFAIQHVLD